MKWSRPQWVILENVKTLLHARKADEGCKPIDHINATMKNMGYLGMHTAANTHCYGLPQSRTRVWMIFIRADAFSGSSSSLNACFLQFRLGPCSLQTVLQSHGIVHEESAKTQGKDLNLKKTRKWPEKYKQTREILGGVAWPSPARRSRPLCSKRGQKDSNHRKQHFTTPPFAAAKGGVGKGFNLIPLDH